MSYSDVLKEVIGTDDLHSPLAIRKIMNDFNEIDNEFEIYGNEDNMQDENIIKNFSENFSCKLSILEDGEHYFHTEKQLDYYKNWLSKTII